MANIFLTNYRYELKRLYKYFKEQNLSNFSRTFADKLYRWTHGISNPKYSKITENIMIGGQPSEKGLDRLKNKGISLLINLRDEFDYRELIDTNKIKYIYLPTEDDHPISLENMKTGIDEIKSEIENGGKVYIHCLEGLGRSVALLAAYFMKEKNLSYQESIEKIKAKRPFINPSNSQEIMLKKLDE